MKTLYCQRWRERRATYRPAREVIQTRDYEVAAVHGDREAKAFVVQHHYERSYPAALARFGLYRAGEMVGVAVLSQPASQAALDAALPFPGARRGELGRFVLLDEVPANGESWFLARAFELARGLGFQALVAHSDPEPRFTREQGCVFPGHVGTIYQATNAIYAGRTRPRTRRLFDDGTVFSSRAWSKLRLRDRGWQAVLDQLIAHGAPAPRRTHPGDAWSRWVRTTVTHVTRTQRHGGSHRYIWTLDRGLRAPLSLRYPKFDFGRTLPLDLPAPLEPHTHRPRTRGQAVAAIAPRSASLVDI